MVELRSDKPWKPATIAIGLALAVHAFLLLSDVLPAMLRGWNDLYPRPKAEELTQVEMVRMTPEQFEQNRQLADLQPEPPPAPQPPPPPEPPKPQGQVVDLAPTPDSRPPLEARFLSEHNTKVKKESVSADQRPDYEKPKPAPTLAKAQPRPEPERPKPEPEAKPEPKRAVPAPDEDKKAEQRDPGDDPSVEVPDSSPGQAPSQADSDQRPDQPPGEPAPPADSADQTVAMNEPSDRAVPDDEAGAPAPDRIRDVPTGPATFLNSREFMYATFFNRVKRTVGQFWHPSVRDELDRRELTGRGPIQDELITQVVVSLEPNGDLEAVQLVRSCGVSTLDNLALKAFQQAAPFPNPPQGLAGPDGRIRFAFGFSVSQNYGPIVQAYRPQRIR